MLITTSFILLLSIIFILAISPLAIAATLILLSILISVSLTLLSLTPWFSLALIITWARGIIVVFIYVSSLTSNSLFSAPSQLLLPLLLVFIFPIFLPSYPNIIDINSLTYSSAPLTPTIIYKIYSLQVGPLSIFIILYLLIGLLVVIKIATSQLAPLRLK